MMKRMKKHVFGININLSSTKFKRNRSRNRIHVRRSTRQYRHHTIAVDGGIHLVFRLLQDLKENKQMVYAI
ncbi:unnamed protein product [Lactuca virosa]|uniref:Uncharacterized protein n=1 Tax=Lactuca virosa TaxID=75947 RepID=A0AAU9PID7_9ASTR|nr:unnamed protein product [Lactuca virosa]